MLHPWFAGSPADVRAAHRARCALRTGCLPEHRLSQTDGHGKT